MKKLFSFLGGWSAEDLFLSPDRRLGMAGLWREAFFRLAIVPRIWVTFSPSPGEVFLADNVSLTTDWDVVVAAPPQ